MTTQEVTFLFGGSFSNRKTYEYLPKDSTEWLMGKTEIPGGFEHGCAIAVKSGQEIWLIGGWRTVENPYFQQKWPHFLSTAISVGCGILYLIKLSFLNRCVTHFRLPALHLSRPKKSRRDGGQKDSLISTYVRTWLFCTTCRLEKKREASVCVKKKKRKKR